jgi:predicted amidohydrolase YtcJ
MMKKLTLFFLLISACFVDAQPLQRADIVLRHGHIYTMDERHPWAESIAVGKGRILFIGADKGLRPYMDDHTKVIELSGKFVMPSFIDSHVHPLSAGIEMQQLDVGTLQTKEEILKAVKEYADAHPKAAWIIGNTWQLPVFPGANPKKEWLDEIVPDRPVLMTSADGHSIWVNSKALELAGVNKDTPDPPNGRIERNENGEPSGTLRESASRLIEKVAPEPTEEQRLDGLKAAVQKMNQLGITGFQDASVQEDSLKIYAQADQQGILTARVRAAQYADPKLPPDDQIEKFKEFRAKYHGDHYNADSVKIFADGVIEANTAAMLQPYLDGKKDRGIYNWQPDALNSFVKALDQEKFQIHIHAIGDGAIREALDALEYARKQNGPRDARPIIAHLQVIDSADIPRFHSIPVIACFQPLWAFEDDYIKDMTYTKIGPERSRELYPIGSVVKAKGPIAFGSDWSVSSVNPLDGIEVAVTRCDPDQPPCNNPLLPNEKIDLATALRAYTLGAAYANFWDKETGSLETGKSADLIVLSQDLFKIPPADINQTKVEMTIFEGKVIDQ